MAKRVEQIGFDNIGCFINMFDPFGQMLTRFSLVIKKAMLDSICSVVLLD